MPVTITSRARLSRKSTPSEAFPRHTPKRIPPRFLQAVLYPSMISCISDLDFGSKNVSLCSRICLRIPRLSQQWRQSSSAEKLGKNTRIPPGVIAETRLMHFPSSTRYSVVFRRRKSLDSRWPPGPFPQMPTKTLAAGTT
eukprot:scaffold501_cov355-Pinguiococcus_pyrenoidosus.AAC.4